MTTTRRNLLCLTGAAISAAALPALANDRAPADPLIALAAAHLAATTAAGATSKRLSAVEKALGPTAFGNPKWGKGWNFSKSPLGLAHCSNLTTTPPTVCPEIIERYNASTESIVADGARSGDPEMVAELARRQAEGRARVTWWKDAKARQEAMQVAAGYPEALAAYEAAWAEVARIDNEILRTPARTLEGLRIKLEQMAEQHRGLDIDCSEAERHDLDVSDDYLVAAIRDVRTMMAATQGQDARP